MNEIEAIMKLLEAVPAMKESAKKNDAVNQFLADHSDVMKDLVAKAEAYAARKRGVKAAREAIEGLLCQKNALEGQIEDTRRAIAGLTKRVGCLKGEMLSKQKKLKSVIEGIEEAKRQYAFASAPF